MENERQILEKLIADGKDAERKLKDLEVTYSVGDRFAACDKKKLLLVKIWVNTRWHAAIIDLASGCQHDNPIPVNDPYKIIKEELAELCSCAPTRYYDSRKKVKT